jgi:hypothetical protein
LYPSQKSFKPAESLRDYVAKVSGSNYDGRKNSFLDKFEEPNCSLIRDFIEKNTQVYRNAQW